MTDFYAQLEEQLIAAGRRRQAQRRIARAVAGRGRMLIAATAAVAVIVAAAIALPSLTAREPRSESAAPQAPVAPPDSRRKTSLAGIRVAVYNAAAEPGLGRRVGDELRSHGARVFVFGGVPSQPGGRSVVRYRRGAEARARLVADVLRVARIDPYDPPAAEANPPASARAMVIVLVGYDLQTDP